MLPQNWSFLEKVDKAYFDTYPYLKIEYEPPSPLGIGALLLADQGGLTTEFDLSSLINIQHFDIQRISYVDKIR